MRDIRSSVEAILRNQSEGGAFVASPDFATYHYCWLRDGSFTAYALDRAGEHDASARYHAWADRAIGGIGELIDAAIDRCRDGLILAGDHLPPARFALDGSTVRDDWPNFQIDGYGTWLWALGEHLDATGRDGLPEEWRGSVAQVGRYLAALAFTPCYDVWEESGTALHTSTLAAVYGGLRTAARLLDDAELAARAESVRASVRDGAARLGRYVKSNQSDDVDSSLLWLALPFGVVEPGEAAFARTVRAIEEDLAFQGGLRRYPSDTYFGSGAWPVLTASLGWDRLAVGDRASAERCRDWVAGRFDREGHLGEQFGGAERDPEHYREWLARWGHPAIDLTWSHAMYVVLCTAMAATGDGRDPDGPVASLADGARRAGDT